MSSKLRYFVKLDSSNVPVIGSNINRVKRPSTGNWQEIEPIDCCGPELTFTPEDEYAAIIFTLSCDASEVFVASFEDSAASIYALAAFLNKSLGFLGYFSINADDDLVFQVKTKVVTALCPDGTLTFEISAS